MAKVKPAEIIDHLGPQIRKALEDAAAKITPQAPFDAMEFYMEFKRAVGRRCRPWEIVPNNLVDGD